MADAAATTTTTTTSDSTHDQIWHKTIGDKEKPSLLFLHGLFGSHLEFLPIASLLQDHYHIILVDLPGHSRSRSGQLSHYRMPQTVDALAQLIRTQSPQKRAHVAAMSFGGFIGLELARKHADLVQSLFATGAPPFEGKERFFASRPNLLYCLNAVTFYSPDFLFHYVCRAAGAHVSRELRAEMKENFTFALTSHAFSDILLVTLHQVEQIRGVRVAAVAGGKQDNVDVTRRMGQALQQNESASHCQAFVVQEALHAWHLQYSQLFAQGIHCWIRGDPMPALFHPLN